MKAKKVIFFTNGNTMVFGNHGIQIPKLQGFIFDIVDKLQEACDEDTEFIYSKFGTNRIDCNFKWWFEQRKDKCLNCEYAHLCDDKKSFPTCDKLKEK